MKDMQRYLHHSHQGWPVYDTQTSPSLTGQAMKRDDLFAGYEQGQRDMLAKCIAAVRPVAEFQIRFAANLWSCDPMNCELCDCGMDSARRLQIEATARSQAEVVLDALRALQETP